MASGVIYPTFSIKKANFSTTVGSYGEILCTNIGSSTINIIGLQVTKVDTSSNVTNLLCTPRLYGGKIRGFYLYDLITGNKVNSGTVVEGSYFYIEN